ncbi:MAG: DciA family protein, partial [Terracidiphilus sp.]
MNRAGDFLGNVIRRINHPDATLAWLESAWPSVVGAHLAVHTRPLRCVGDRLELSADSSVWQSQLSGMEQDLCTRINSAWGGTLVRQLKFVARPVAAVSREADNSHTPFIRRRRA